MEELNKRLPKKERTILEKMNLKKGLEMTNSEIKAREYNNWLNEFDAACESAAKKAKSIGMTPEEYNDALTDMDRNF